tara:strand:- start:132 stop:269 length:138 start_codon:yes stop_codon:yes gene_type:complete
MTNKKITLLVSGNFNILHPGHIKLFIAAKKIGNFHLNAQGVIDLI